LSQRVSGAGVCRFGRDRSQREPYFRASGRCPDCRDERPNAQDVHDAREVVGQNVQGHFSADPFQRLHQEVGGSHPGFDCAEGMLDRLTPLTHLLWMLVEPALDRLENMFMLPSGDPTLLTGGAVVLDSAALARVGPVAA